MGDTSETNTKALSREFFLGVVALKRLYGKNHYLRDMGPFPRYCHILTLTYPIQNNIFNLSHAIVEVAGSSVFVFVVVVVVVVCFGQY